MKWQDVADTLGRYAPTVGAAIAGPAGSAIGSLVAQALGVDDTPEAVAAALTTDPEAAIKLRKIDADLAAVTIEAQSRVVVAEASGESWLQRNWRPVMMLIFTGLILARWMGWSAPGLTEADVARVMDIIELGVGGYVVGRSVEKVAKTVTGSTLMDRITTKR